MANHGLHFIKWSCEAFLADPDVAMMEPGEVGIYVLLLNQSFLTDDCGLPSDERSLRKLARCDKDDWEEYWPLVSKKFYEDDGRLHNKRMVEEWEKAKIMYDTAVKNGSKGGRPKKVNKPKQNPALNPEITQPFSENNPALNPEHKLNVTQEKANQKPETRNQKPEEKNENLQKPEGPTPLSGLVSGDLTFTSETSHYERVKNILTPGSWKKSSAWFCDCVDRLPSHKVEEILKATEDRMNPEMRTAKGYGQLKNPGGFLSKLFQDAIQAHGL